MVSDTSTDLMRRALAIACAALDEPEAQRRSWADAQCGNDATLRAEVRSLLAADESPEHILKSALTEPEAEDPWPGRQVGRYRIIERIGSGGMGTVYRAEPESGVTRQPVALKLIKRGMDTEEILRRFIREREILARLDHPHIARLLDGGMTTDGRPWFAMELVIGEPLIDYCDRRRLSLDERVRLFLQVCDAVAYAHRSLVVHRDLKPGNVLVGGDGQSKLLDFGIAKLVDADGEAVTRSQAAMMTPDYAAPEQYDRGQITTQTDVYLLGVMLTELLTGRRPPWPVRMKADETGELPRLDAAFATRAAQLDPTLQGLAECRGLSVAALARALRGDLDRIARYAMRWEPERRYAGAGAMAEDLRRYLRGEPVLAMEASFRYRAGKFLRRHRIAALASLTVALMLTISTAIAWRDAERLRVAQAQILTALELVQEVFLGADPYLSKGNDTRAADLLDGARDRLLEHADLPPALATQLWGQLGSAYVSLDNRVGAEAALRAAIAAGQRALACSGGGCVGPDRTMTQVATAAARARLAHYRLVEDDDQSALPELESAIATLRSLRPSGRAELAQALQFYSDNEFNQSRYERLDALSAEAVELVRDHPDVRELLGALVNRASLLRVVNQPQAAQATADEAFRIANATPGLSPGTRLIVEQQYAGTLVANGRAVDALPILREARERSERVNGAGSTMWTGLTWELANAEDSVGHPAAAVDEFRRLLPHLAAMKSANVAAIHNGLGNTLVASGQAQEAVAEFDLARKDLCSEEPPNVPCVVVSLNQVDALLGAQSWDVAASRLQALEPQATAGRIALRWHWLQARLQLAHEALDQARQSLQSARSSVAAGEQTAIDRARLADLEAQIAEAAGDRAAALQAWKAAEAAYAQVWVDAPPILLRVRARVAELSRVP